MAQAASGKQIEDSAEQENDSAAEAKVDAQATARLGEFLRKYAPAQPAERDVLQDRYQVNLSSPLPEFDTKSARAYVAIDLADQTRQLFAQVCHPETLQRYRAITMLKGVTHPSIATLMAAGPVHLSQPQEERYVIIYERPVGKKLSDLLAQTTVELSVHFICDRILAPLASAIHQFSELDISHGLLNPDNVYFRDVAQLGPCVSEPCGYAQPFYFEPLERMQAMPAGKGEGTTAQDYYALAVLVLYILHGKQHFTSFSPDALARSIFKDGVYNALTRQRDVPEMFYDFFRGMFCQYPEDRWSYRYVKPWLDGKRYNVLSPPPPVEAIRPFEFADAQAGTRRELAHLFATHWDIMPAAISNNQLNHWVAVSLRNKELAESMARMTRGLADLGVKNEVMLNEQLMRIILMLDSHGPIRIKQLSFHIDGIDSLYAELYLTKANAELQLLAKFIEFNIASYWLELQRKGQDYVVPVTINAICTRLDRLRTYVRNTGLGFGLERVLYDLNPEMPCISPLFAGAYVDSLSTLLIQLDRMAASQSKQDEPIDRHIAAYIASKLSIQHEIRLHDLAAVPAMATNRAVIALYLLSMAQHRCKNIQLPGLSHWLGLRIIPLLDSIHSRTLRHEFKLRLAQQSQSGYLPALSDVIINAEYTTADQNGYSHAWQTYQNNAELIESYRQGRHLERQSSRVGFRMAKTLAYIGVLFSLALMLRDIGL